MAGKQDLRLPHPSLGAQCADAENRTKTRKSTPEGRRCKDCGQAEDSPDTSTR